VRTAFNARRKIFLTYLRKYEPEIFACLSEETVKALKNRRPENLLPAQFLNLYQSGSL